jgi:hypothetical protein
MAKQIAQVKTYFGIVIDDENVSFSFHAPAFIKITTVKHLACSGRSGAHQVSV